MPRTRTLIPAICLISGLLLIGSELLNTFTIETTEGQTVELVGAAERHSFAFGLLGLLAIAGTVIAVVAGSRPAALMVVTSGIVALALFAVIDLPDAGTSDLIADANQDFAEGTAEPAGAFWISLIASLLCVAGGALLASLTPAQLRALRPGRGRATSSSS